MKMKTFLSNWKYAFFSESENLLSENEMFFSVSENIFHENENYFKDSENILGKVKIFLVNVIIF